MDLFWTNAGSLCCWYFRVAQGGKSWVEARLRKRTRSVAKLEPKDQDQFQCTLRPFQDKLPALDRLLHLTGWSFLARLVLMRKEIIMDDRKTKAETGKGKQTVRSEQNRKMTQTYGYYYK